MLYRHYQTEKNGCLTVAFQTVGGAKAEMGISWCSPKDKFTRSKGRMIAVRRLDTKRDNGYYVAMDLMEMKLGTPTDYIFGLLEKTRKPGWYPAFRRRLAEQRHAFQK